MQTTAAAMRQVTDQLISFAITIIQPIHVAAIASRQFIINPIRILITLLSSFSLTISSWHHHSTFIQLEPSTLEGATLGTGR